MFLYIIMKNEFKFLLIHINWTRAVNCQAKTASPKVGARSEFWSCARADREASTDSRVETLTPAWLVCLKVLYRRVLI